MDYAIMPMTSNEAVVVSQWHYPGRYAFYDWDADPDDLDELLQSVANDQGKYFAVRNQSDGLVGFLEFTVGPDIVEIGLGLAPEPTGRGLGLSFVQSAIEFCRQRYQTKTLRVSVAHFNQRAITTYQRAGFRIASDVYRKDANGGTFEFVDMILVLEPKGIPLVNSLSIRNIVLQEISVGALAGNPQWDLGSQAKDAFSRLEAKLSTLKGRKFYGIYDGQIYRAAVGLFREDTAEGMGLEPLTIAGGSYVTCRLKHWEQYIDRLGDIVQWMMESAPWDSARPTVEFYRSHDTLDLWVPVLG
ncbi:MAG: hypothetical protein C7B46_06345 [Sulfobacillus benefaciens]|uniref:N-acetyltransferase domain-containing protein n=1 Tax=Sulfobacillus benefaciens TaxID=453960 RepID=A0A2T2XI15_9FIRM|nr:MAG: hypothetical protein C7B46_06345 [Sulfobacillus benefaciens]